MRVVTLFEPATQQFLSEHFVLVTHNQMPELYCSSSTIDATVSNAYPSEQLAAAHEGAGGGNVRSFFCTADGRVVNYVAGFWGPSRFLAEANWSLDRMRTDAATTARDHREQIDDYERQRDAIATPDEVAKLATALTQGSSGNATQETLATIRKVKALNRLARSHRESQPLLHQPIRSVLQQIEDDIYIKGQLGCE
jgi:hypothetical protein